MRTWIPLTKFQIKLKSRYETKEEILELLEISRPTLDRLMREEYRFLPFLSILSRDMKIQSTELFNLINNSI